MQVEIAPGECPTATAYHGPDGMVMFAVRYEDGASAYIRVPPGLGTFGVSPAVKIAHGAQARGEVQSGLIRKSSEFASPGK